MENTQRDRGTVITKVSSALLLNKNIEFEDTSWKTKA
jgi:hypothetical protein